MSIQSMIKKQDNRIKEKAKAIKPQVWIGKNGLTEQVIEQIKKLLKKRRILKIKLLKSFLEKNNKKHAAKKLAELTESEVVDSTGFVVVLYKR